MNHDDPRVPISADEQMDQAVALVSMGLPAPFSAPLPAEAVAASASPLPQALPTPHVFQKPQVELDASGPHETSQTQVQPQPQLTPDPAPVSALQPTPNPSAVNPGCACGGTARTFPEHIGRRPPAYPLFPKNKPAVGEDDFAAFTPDTIVDGLTVPGLAVLGASMRGDSHRWEGTCRQDAMVLARIGEGNEQLLVLAVADGVGSSKRSHVASQELAHAVIKALDTKARDLHNLLAAQDHQMLIAAVNSAIGEAVPDCLKKWAAKTAGFDERDYATTLHLLLVPTDTKIRDRVWVSIGDGGLLRLVDGEWHGLEGQDGGIASTRTTALPSTRYAAVALLRSEPGELLLLGTDGITNPINQEPEFRARLAAYWGIGEVPTMSEFLRQAQLRAKTYDDDRTVICVWEGVAGR
ncbi:protein phosphatase 2C domain-containing protein [Streptomyces sp. NPDC015220]|uniref:PP2C family serine/threonine-protein phosphatase n=1 Tax=Streptomyces sp. NPDC015220 TaxID=3364947 RepID=UPI0036FB3664